jgi:type IV pilus assembly protein PilC
MADLYGREVDDQISTATTLLEPAITVVMGVAVGLIALAVVLPMFNLMDTLRPS